MPANPAWCLTGLSPVGKRRDIWRLVTGKACRKSTPSGSLRHRWAAKKFLSIRDMSFNTFPDLMAIVSNVALK